MREQNMLFHQLILRRPGTRVISLLLVLFCGCDSSDAPASFRVGIVSGFAPFGAISEGFREEMGRLGYREGKNIAFDFREIDPFDPRDTTQIQLLINSKVDVLVSYPTQATLMARDCARDSGIPLVFALAGIEGNDLIQSIPKPGGNITGVRYPGPDMVVKSLELIQEIAPNITHIWMGYNPGYPVSRHSLPSLRNAADRLGYHLTESPVSSPGEIGPNLQRWAEANRSAGAAILILPDDITQSREGWEIIWRNSEKYRIPIVGSGRKNFQKHTIFSLSPSLPDYGALAARQVDQILRGMPAGEIMVTTPNPKLTINYKLASELGLAVPEGMLSKADEIIK